MKALKIAVLTLGVVFSISSVVLAAGAEPTIFTKKPKVIGDKISTVSGFQVRQHDGSGTFHQLQRNLL